MSVRYQIKYSNGNKPNRCDTAQRGDRNEKWLNEPYNNKAKTVCGVYDRNKYLNFAILLNLMSDGNSTDNRTDKSCTVGHIIVMLSVCFWMLSLLDVFQGDLYSFIPAYLFCHSIRSGIWDSFCFCFFCFLFICCAILCSHHSHSQSHSHARRNCFWWAKCSHYIYDNHIHNQNNICCIYLPPPLRYTRWGKRQTLPKPTA